MPKILAIDDKIDNLISLKALLKNLMPGVTVSTALSGQDGLDLAIQEKPDTILLDIKMPKMDGYEVCRRLKADPILNVIPILMITAIMTDSKSRIKGLELGADAFLNKPFDENELVAQIKSMLRIKRAEDTLRFERDLLEDKVSVQTKELRQSEKKYRNLFEKSADASLIIKNGKFADCNQATVEMLRFNKKEELLNTHPSKLSPDVQPDGRSSFEKADEMMKLAIDNGSHRFEWYHQKADGEVFPVEVLLTPIPSATDDLIIHTVWRDITDRKKIEKEIDNNSFLLQNLLTIGRQLTSSLEIKKVFKHVLEEVRALLGCNGATIYMLDSDGNKLIPVLSFDPPFEESIMKAKVDVDNSLTGKAIKAKKGMIFNNSGQISGSFQVPGTPVDNDHLIIAPFIVKSKAIGSLNIYRKEKIFSDDDLATVETFTMYASTGIHNANTHQELINQVTERRLVENRLAIEKQRLADILEGTNVGTWEWNVQTGETVFSERWANIIGYTLEEISPTNFETWTKFMHPDDLKIAQKELDKHFSGEKDYYDVEFRQSHKNGSWVWINARGKVVKWSKDKKPIKMSGTHLDISNSKRIEEEREAAFQNAQKANNVKDIFLANMSHEIRTPLNAILGFTNLIEENKEGKLSKEDQEFFDIVRNSGNRLMNTVHGILDMAQIQAGTFIHNPETIDIVKITNGIVNEFQLFVKEKNLELSFETDLKNGLVIADEGNVSRAISNLVENAIKYTKKGQVDLRLKKIKKEYVLSIKDTGVGIDKEYQEKMYDAFSQESTGYTREYQGLGMGLAITKRCLDMDNILLGVKSTKGAGTTFTLTFESIIGSDDKVNPAREIATKTTSPKKDSSKKSLVLYVEDDPSSQLLMKAQLGKKYDSLFAKSVSEAKQHLEKEKIEIVLLDLSLGKNEDGLDLARFMKKQKHLKDIPIMAVTAHAFTTDRDNVFAAGCDEFISKPVNRELLLEKIDEYLISD